MEAPGERAEASNNSALPLYLSNSLVDTAKLAILASLLC
jgi:hypothetical protein